MNEQDKNSSRGYVDQPSAPPPTPYYYGTFQGVVNSQPPPPPFQPVAGYSQPVPPVAYYSHGYQNVPGHTYSHILSNYFYFLCDYGFLC